MNEEGEEGAAFAEWDADFLDQLIQVEELALSSSSSSLPNPNNSSEAPISYSTQPPPPRPLQNSFISYSPPRELSQRPIHFNNTTTTNTSTNTNTNAFDRFSHGVFRHSAPSSSLLPQSNAKDEEILLLKKELGRVSKQLTELEQECFELRKLRNKNEQQIDSLYSHAHQKREEASHYHQNAYFSQSSNVTGYSGREHGFRTVDTSGTSQLPKKAKASEDQISCRIDIATSSSKAIGVQTEKAADFTGTDLNNDLASCLDLSKNLLGIWGSTSDQKLGRNLMSKLFMACPTDFFVLFGCMSANISSKITMDSLAVESSSHAAFQSHLRSFPTLEASKVSHLYSVLTKISNGLLQLEALLGPLLDLCDVESVAVLCSSLRILHRFLKLTSSLGRTVEERDNVEVEGLCSGSSVEGRDLFSVSRDEASYAASYKLFGIRSSDSKVLRKKRRQNFDIALGLSSMNWVSLFVLMYQIAVTNTEECVRLEAVSIMNVIIMNSNAYMEREKFGQTPIFQNLAQLLKKEAGVFVQNEALRLLYSLLNCPKLLSIFCSGCKEGESADAADDEKNASSLKGFSCILEGLAECIGCFGNSTQDIKIRKRAIVMLAFLASSGKSGFEIMVNCKLPGETNFLMLILQMLALEMDMEVSIFSEPAESVEARTLVIREALILLNRLVSNPAYSATILRLLTESRDMASLTIDIASRLSRKCYRLKQSDTITQQIRASEIVDLAQVFKKRVFTYLGDKLS